MSHVDRRVRSAGFTLIELTLAMSFISALLLAIAMTIIQMSQTYNKGMVLKEVNQSARDINDTLRRSVADTSQVDMDQGYVTNTAGGRLCLGNYSYIWNTAEALERGDANLTAFEPNAASGWSEDTILRLVRVEDTSRLYCAEGTSGGFIQRAIRAEDADKTDILLQAGEHTINVLDIAVFPATEAPGDTNYDPATGERLITITYRLGTGDVSAMTENQTACLPPSDPNSDLAYCNVQEFTIAVSAGSGVN